ncbi:L-2-amino-thiazoline-4-carboxylic acid hydrolase [Emticicia sp. BO119]|uniref:L-2-amino-thiazoline-4-carboxylic acid hydrolase n=1 Tax=Emticicia sp. BO119 TaxID=2757768 RepID=UPI0015F03CFC|nr:L-2-amino-thiazoline-4-carboxylic acid hydrolase [Emticicia sp. BO119]MBA4850664.1 L-2-amino-thiazoline-4-carboxylic acid hydrolase [Emticicia sp. BO119]
MTHAIKSISKKGVLFAVGYVAIKWLIILSVGTYLSKQGLWKNGYLFILPVIAVSIGAFRYFKKEPAYKRYFRKALENYYPKYAKELLDDIDAQYEALKTDVSFAKTSANPMDKRLDLSAYFLALIMVLDKAGENFAKIREVALFTITEYLRPKTQWQAFLKRLPVRLIKTDVGRYLVKIFAKKVGQRGNPEGFVAHIITDKKETHGLGYGVDIIECGICKLFKKHNYQKYVSILCEVDKYTTSLAGLSMIRTDTIANGASKCDFRYQLKSEILE